MAGGTDLALLGVQAFDYGWLVFTGFAVAFGAAIYRVLPWAIGKAMAEKIDQRITAQTVMHEKAQGEVDQRFDDFEAFLHEHCVREENIQNKKSQQLDEIKLSLRNLQQQLEHLHLSEDPE